MSGPANWFSQLAAITKFGLMSVPQRRGSVITTVIGIAGGSQKCACLTGEAGFDGAIDYKNEDVGAALSLLCPKGIDIYFDNVGGEILDEVMARIANGARIVLCGGISQYNQPQGVFGAGPKNYFNLILRNARMEGRRLRARPQHHW